MHLARWIVARARARPALPAAVCLIVSVAALILGGVSGLADQLATSAAREQLRATSAHVTIQVRVGTDAAEQDLRARRALTDGFAPARVEIFTTLISEPITVRETRIVAWSALDLDPTTVDLAAGRWPSGPDEAALQADAAELAGLGLGDIVDMGGRRVRISATWRPADPEAQRWQWDPLALTGEGPQVVGPLLASAEAVEAVQGDAMLRWSVVPVIPATTAGSLPALRQGAAIAKDVVGDADVTGRGVTVEGDLGWNAAKAAQAWGDARALGAVPLTLVSTVVVVAVAQVGRLTLAMRETETRVLLARGAAPNEVVAISSVESGAAAALGAMIGGAAGAVMLRAATGGWAQFPAAMGGSAATLLTAIVTLVVGARFQVHGLAGAPSRDRASAVGPAVGAVILLVTALAALTTWRLLRAGRITGGAGFVDVSLVGALAPSALLWAAATASVMFLVAAARAAHAVGARRWRGQLVWLAGAHVARSVRVVSVPAALTVMAVGSVTLASLFVGSSRLVEENLAALQRGAELRAGLTEPPVDRAKVRTPPALTQVDGVRVSSPVWLDPGARLGDVGIHLTAAPLDSLADVATLPAGSGVPAAQLRPTAEAGPIAVPEGAAELTVRVTGALSIDAWQEADLRLTPEMSRRQMDAPWVSDPQAAAREATADRLSRRGASTTITTSVTLRDADTGLSGSVAGPEVRIPGLGIDWDPATDEVTWTPTSSTGESAVSLPPDTRLLIDEVAIVVDGGDFGRLALDIRVAADGVDVDAERVWRSNVAVPVDGAEPYRALVRTTPVVAGIREISEGDLTTYSVTTNRPAIPPLVAAVGGGWSIEGDRSALASLRLGPRIAFTGSDPAGVAGVPDPGPRLPVALSEPAARAAGLEVGDSFELFAFQRPLPATLATIMESVPGTMEPLSALADSRAIGQAMVGQRRGLPWPTEAWASADRPGEARTAAARIPGVDVVLPAPAGAPSAGASRQIFLAGAAGVLALGLAGIAATYVTQLDARREEAGVLRRLGVAGGSQALGRAVEHAVVALSAAALGVGAGWAIGAAVTAPLVRTAVGADGRWPVPMRLDVGGWVGALVAGAVALFLLIMATARRTRLQAEPRRVTR